MSENEMNEIKAGTDGANCEHQTHGIQARSDDR
jgi:hypothetical protein